MITNVYLEVAEDSYQVEVDLERHEVKIIWRYRFNRPSRPEPIKLDDLSVEVYNMLEDKLSTNYGFSLSDIE